MAQLNDYEFAILGGWDGSDRLGDIFIFAVDRDTLERRVENKESSFWDFFGGQIKFECDYIQSTMVTIDTVAVVANIRNDEYHLHLIKWKKGDAAVTKLRKLD